MHGSRRVAPAAADLGRRPPLRFGALRLTPATRRVEGPLGSSTVPPRIMHVLLALIDSAGAVLTRDDIVQICWGDRFVADDSLNNAIAEVRRTLRDVAPDVVIETVPKTGYRIVVSAAGENEADAYAGALNPAKSDGVFSRRALVIGGLSASGAALGLAAWSFWDRSAGSTTDALVEQGLIALRQGLPDDSKQAVTDFRRATELEPDNARNWGLLALAWRSAAEVGSPAEAASARRNGEIAAKRALAIDPKQSDALTALATLTPLFGDWVEAERRLREVLAIDPNNSFAVGALGTLLMSTGQVGACLQSLDWLAERIPLSPNLQFRRVYTLWSAGQLAEMDRLADRSMQMWPTHPAVWFARLWTLAFTGRVPQAQLMLRDGGSRPAMPKPVLELLGRSVAACASSDQAVRQAAVRTNLDAAAAGPGAATTAIMVASYLGAPGEALAIARGFLTQTGPVVVQSRHTPSQVSVTDQHHRLTMMLWVPATELLRLHPDFTSLCDAIGLVDYWRDTRTRPDFAGGQFRAMTGL